MLWRKKDCQFSTKCKIEISRGRRSHKIEFRGFLNVHVRADLGGQLSGSRCLYIIGSWRATAWMCHRIMELNTFMSRRILAGNCQGQFKGGSWRATDWVWPWSKNLKTLHDLGLGGWWARLVTFSFFSFFLWFGWPKPITGLSGCWTSD